MTEIVLLVLAIVWAVVLVPGWIRNFLERGGRRTPMMAWQRQLDTLSRTTPAAGLPAPFGARVLSVDRRGVYQRPRSSVPNNSREAAVRRRDILRLLGVGLSNELVRLDGGRPHSGWCRPYCSRRRSYFLPGIAQPTS